MSRAPCERLERLPADQRAVILLAAAGYSPTEIAAFRGLTVRQVRKRIEKANRALREGD
ncbi:MAG: sigma factor-like helix-turn-helix DNA-binding protein [Solirubrobacterales bacterium]